MRVCIKNWFEWLKNGDKGGIRCFSLNIKGLIIRNIIKYSMWDFE